MKHEADSTWLNQTQRHWTIPMQLDPYTVVLRTGLRLSASQSPRAPRTMLGARASQRTCVRMQTEQRITFAASSLAQLGFRQPVRYRNLKNTRLPAVSMVHSNSFLTQYGI